MPHQYVDGYMCDGAHNVSICYHCAIFFLCPVWKIVFLYCKCGALSCSSELIILSPFYYLNSLTDGNNIQTFGAIWIVNIVQSFLSFWCWFFCSFWVWRVTRYIKEFIKNKITMGNKIATFTEQQLDDYQVSWTSKRQPRTHTQKKETKLHT